MQWAIDELPAADENWKLPYDGPDAFNQTFDCWVRQMGHPLVTVSSVGDETRLNQVRFLQNGGITELDQPTSSLKYLWNIPISYITLNTPSTLEWIMNDGSDLILAGEVGKDFWLDPESMGFMRIHYGSQLQFRQVWILTVCDCILLLLLLGY